MTITFPPKWSLAWTLVFQKKCTAEDVSNNATWGEFRAQKLYVYLEPHDAYVVYITGSGVKVANSPDIQIPVGPMLSGSSLFAVYVRLLYTTTSNSFTIKVLNWIRNSNYIALPVIFDQNIGRQGIWDILQVFYVKNGTLYVETFTKRYNEEEWIYHGVVELGEFTPTSVRLGVEITNNTKTDTVYVGVEEFDIFEVNQMAQSMQQMMFMMMQMMFMMMQMMLMMTIMRMLMGMFSGLAGAFR